MYGEVRSNIDILYQIVWEKKYYTISLSDNTILMMLLNVWTMRQTEIHFLYMRKFNYHCQTISE